jgi:hypothetical protein
MFLILNGYRDRDDWIYKYKRIVKSADEKGGKPVQITGARKSGKGPGPDNVAYVAFLGSIIVCRLYKLTLSDQAQVTLQLTVSLSDLV